MGVTWFNLALVTSLLVRVSLLGFESADYIFFWSNWYDYSVQHGRWAALKDDFSNYPPLYLYLLSLSTLLPLPKLHAVKAVPIAFDYLAAWFVFRLVRVKHLTGPSPLYAAAGVLFLPTVVLNSAA
jgi:Gpi18-like mannosyltransferase